MDIVEALSQYSALGDLLPASSQDLGDNFVGVFEQSKEDLTKCQLLTVSREEYRTLAEERCRVNVEFGRVAVDARRMDASFGTGLYETSSQRADT